MRFRLAHSVLLAAFVSDLDTAVPIPPGSAAPDCAGHSERRRIRAARAGGARDAARGDVVGCGHGIHAS